MRAKKKQKEVVTPQPEKQEKYLPDHINKEKLKNAIIKTNMNIELCAIEAGVPIEDLTKWIAEDYEEIKQWKEIVYVKTATDAFNILIDLAQNEEITITEDMKNKKQKYTSEAQIKAITTILDRVGYKIGLAAKQQKKETGKQPVITLMPAEKYLQKQHEVNDEPETEGKQAEKGEEGGEKEESRGGSENEGGSEDEGGEDEEEGGTAINSDS